LKINLRQEIAMWVLGLLWTALGISVMDSMHEPMAAVQGFTVLFLALVPIGLILFSLRDRKKSN
jgi:hypothetical protein